MNPMNEILKHSSRKPQSVLRIVLAIAVVMLVMWMFLVSRMEVQPPAQKGSEVLTEQTGEQPARSLRESLLESTNEEEISPESVSPAEVSPSEKESRSMMSRALPTFIIMMIVIAGIWIWAKRKEKTGKTSTGSRAIGNYELGQGSELRFIEINHEVWVLALTNGSVELLHRYPKSEWSDEQADTEISKADFRSFYNLLKN